MNEPVPRGQCLKHQYYTQFHNVYLHCNNETGEWLWSIVSEDFECYWVNSFKTKKEALDLCKEYKYNVSKIINDKE